MRPRRSGMVSHASMAPVRSLLHSSSVLPVARGPGVVRDFPIVRFGILDDLAAGVFEYCGDVLKVHYAGPWDWCRL